MGVNGGSTYGLGLDQCSGRHLLDASERLVDFEHVAQRSDNGRPSGSITANPIAEVSSQTAGKRQGGQSRGQYVDLA